jgi:transcriptional regulator with PAS, ATPase and Fis domain
VVSTGQFREDFYDRLHVVPLLIPPLRARKEDIVPLARKWSGTLITSYTKRLPDFLRLRRSGCRTIRGRGNLRELRNVIERTMILAPPDGDIDALFLPEEIREHQVVELEESVGSGYDLSRMATSL